MKTALKVVKQWLSKHVPFKVTVAVNNKLGYIHADAICIKYNDKIRIEYYKNNISDDVELLGLILHELGHVVFEGRSNVDNELYAQIFAIMFAEELGKFEVKDFLIEQIERNWGKFKYNKEVNKGYRIYKRASNKFKKNKYVYLGAE